MALLIGAPCQNWKAKLGGIGLWALLIGTQLLLCPHLRRGQATSSSAFAFAMQHLLVHVLFRFDQSSHSWL